VKKFIRARALLCHKHVCEFQSSITLLSRRLQVSLGLGVVITVIGCIWAAQTRISSTVAGTGVLLQIDSLDTVTSQVDGSVQWMFDKPATDWQPLALRFRANPEDFNDQAMVSLAKRILVASDESYKTSETQDAETMIRFREKPITSGQLLAWIKSSSQLTNLANALDQLKRTLRDNSEQRSNIEEQQALLQTELVNRSAFLDNMKRLEGKGFVSLSSILQEQSAVNDISSTIHTNDNQVIALSRERDLALQALRSQLVTLLRQQLIYAKDDLVLVQVNALNGEMVNKGKQLLRLSEQPLNDATLVPVFIASNKAADVQPGMAAIVTPAGYASSQVGGIRGSVVFKANMPGNIETVTARTGDRAFANSILAKEPSPKLVVISLARAKDRRAKNNGGYEWTSNADLPFAPVPGDRLDVKITTRDVRLTELLFSSLKQMLWFRESN